MASRVRGWHPFWKRLEAVMDNACPGCGAAAQFSKVSLVGWYKHKEECPYRLPETTQDAASGETG